MSNGWNEHVARSVGRAAMSMPSGRRETSDLWRGAARRALAILLVVGVLVAMVLTPAAPTTRAEPLGDHGDDYLVGAWYYSAWHGGLQRGLDRPGMECGYEVDYWKYVKNTRRRELDFLYTTAEGEDVRARALGFEPDGELGHILTSPREDTVPLYRLVGKIHYYSVDDDDRKLKLDGEKFKNEGILGYLHRTRQPDTVPLYRIKIDEGLYQLTTDHERAWWAQLYGHIPSRDEISEAIVGYVYAEQRDDTSPLVALYKPLAGQIQPREPLVGYRADTEQDVMDQYITWAADHGIDFFAFDWYWAPKAGCGQNLYLHEALHDAFMRSRYVDRVKFAVAWFPVDAPYSYTAESTDRGLEYFLDTYAAHPSYLKIEGKPVFFWELATIMKSFRGNPDAVGSVITRANRQAQARGFPGVYFIEVGGIGKYEFPKRESVGFEGFTSYSYVPFLKNFEFAPRAQIGPVKRYQDATDEFRDIWSAWAPTVRRQSPGVNFVPLVTAGWDKSALPWVGYTSPILTHNTPDLFGRHLADAREFLDRSPTSRPRMVMINAWNEWFEGAAIEPDTYWGTAYLEQVRAVFGVDARSSRESCCR